MICLCFTVLTAATIMACSAGSVDLTVYPYSKGEDVVQATIDRIDSTCIFPNDKLFLRHVAYVQSAYGDGTKTFRPGYYGGIWQVDEIMFKDTSACPGHLTGVCQQMKTMFNITWQDVLWIDLLKPLHSALAVKLYVELKNMSIIPGSIDDQAWIWATIFNKQSQYAYYINELSAVKVAPCDKKMDVVFVADSSGSIQAPNFLIIKEFLGNVTEGLVIEPDKTRVGFVRFSSSAHLEFYLDTFQTKAAVQGAINNIFYDGGGTNTADAITTVYEEMFVADKGSREEAVKLMLLVTDGMSNSRMATTEAAKKAREKGIIIFTLGIGNANYIELNAVASSPNCTHVFTINTFDELDSLLAEIHKSACGAPRKVIFTDEGTANQTVMIPENGTIDITDTLDQNENGTSITTSVECGVVDVYISYNTPHPGPSLHDIKDTATDKIPSHIYVEATNDGRPLYITYVGKHLPNDITKCDSSKFTIVYTDGKIPETEIKCFQNNIEKICTALDFSNSAYSNLLCREITAPPNPCTDKSLEAGIVYHAYPGDDTKFIKCDLNGKMYITICPEFETYKEKTHSCDVPGSGMTGGNGTVALEDGIANPCTLTAIQDHHLFFAHPDTHFFIQCDGLGNAWKVPCPTGQIWFSNIQTCSPDSLRGSGTTTPGQVLLNPCTSEAIANGKFYHPHPDSAHWFIQCDVSGNYYVKECAGSMIFSTLLSRCT